MRSDLLTARERLALAAVYSIDWSANSWNHNHQLGGILIIMSFKAITQLYLHYLI